jgi:hypothetical protein
MKRQKVHTPFWLTALMKTLNMNPVQNSTVNHEKDSGNISSWRIVKANVHYSMEQHLNVWVLSVQECAAVIFKTRQLWVSVKIVYYSSFQFNQQYYTRIQIAQLLKIHWTANCQIHFSLRPVKYIANLPTANFSRATCAVNYCTSRQLNFVIFELHRVQTTRVCTISIKFFQA